MRPLALDIRAFGPFAEREQIDFTKLAGRDLVLIEGPTGAGKTSILDAMFFALYGSVPGAREQAMGEVKSGFADPKAVCEVTFTFRLGDAVLRVRRVPAQTRQKQRGTGTTEQGAEAQLWELEGDPPVERALASKVSDVNQLVVERVGLTADQFKQVLLLPQGDFRRFLLAPSNEKETLLERLFGTTLYKSVAFRLEADRKLREAEAHDLRAKSDEVLRQRGVSTPDELAGKLDRAAELLAAQERSAAEAARAATGAIEASATAAALAARFASREKAHAELGAIESRLAAAGAEAAALRAAERAAPLRTPLDASRREADALRALGASLGTLEKDAETAAADAAEAGRALAGVAASRERIAAIQTELGGLSGLDEVERDADEAQRAKEDAELRREDARANAARLVAGAQHVRARAEAAAAGAKSAEAAARAAQASAAEARLAREEGISAELSAGLRDGEPCPVCGSRAHPSPAPPKQGAISRARLATLEKAVADAQREAARAGAEASEGAALATSLSAQADALARQIGEASRSRGRGVTAGLAVDARSLAQAASNLSALEEQLAALGARLASSRAQLAARGLAAGEKVAARRRALAAEQAALAAEVERIEQAERDARSRLTTAKALAAERAVEVLAQRTRVAAADDALLDAAREAGFASPADAESAMLPPERVRAIRDKLDRLAREKAAAAQTVKDLDAELAGQVAPDVTALSAAAERAKRDADAARLRQGELAKDLAELEAARAAIGEYGAAFGALEQQLRVLGKLANVVSGKNRLNMSLQRFVLASRMDEVAVAASLRLERMSRGRYVLLRTDDRRARNAGSGLELVVDDRLTGVQRSVYSLSGGEMFLASLSLALGLADVVQAHSGGRRLESLFIDEGFGTLDDETLDQVMRTLEDLRAGGRLVGIISHVDELKERLPTRISVRRGDRGSTTRLVV